MSEQLTLNEEGIVGPIRNDLEAKYRDWLSRNPAVFSMFERFAMQMLARQRRFGVKALAERVRWEVRTTWGEDADGYKFNNNYTAYVARDLMVRYPALENLIETRSIRRDEEEEQ